MYRTANYECRLDKAVFEPCTSALTVQARSKGGKGKQHTISIQAIDGAGNVETEAAIAKFMVIKKG
jgi:hypothetical protein